MSEKEHVEEMLQLMGKRLDSYARRLDMQFITMSLTIFAMAVSVTMSAIALNIATLVYMNQPNSHVRNDSDESMRIYRERGDE